MQSPGPVTLGCLARDGKRLWAYCLNCQHNRFLAPDALGLPAETPVPEVGDRMRCSACGSRRVHTKPEWYLGRGA